MKGRRTKGRSAKRTGAAATLLQRLRRAERQLRSLAEQHDAVMGGINEGVYDWNVEKDTIRYSDRVVKAVGLPRELMNTTADWRSRIHPDDLPRYIAGFIDHFKGKTERFECDYRYRALDGSWRWARQHGVGLRRANGRVYRVIGSTGDITELKQAEESLRKTEERYALATSAAVEGIYEWDIASGSLFLTDRAKAFFLFPAEQLTPGAWNARIHGEDFAGYRQAIIDHFKGRTPQLEHDYRISDGQGGYRWVRERGIGVRDAQGRVVRMVGALSDITQRKRAEIKLQRARDRAEQALKQQTAIAEVLRVMAGSPGDAQPVLDAIARNAVALCDGTRCVVFRFDGMRMHFVAHDGVTPDVVEAMHKRFPRPPSPNSVTDAAILQRSFIHVEDIASDERFPRTAALFGGAHAAILAVPMLKDGQPIGAIQVVRKEPKRYSEEQIALLKAFADQAVIAIENVRLFNETRESLEQQKASGEVLRVISSSIADTAPVFDKILESCQRIFAGRIVGLNLVREDGKLHIGAYHGAHREQFERIFPIPLNPDSGSGLSIVERRVVHYPDAQHGAEVPAKTRQGCTAIGIKSAIFAPLLWEGRGLGAIFVGRDHVSSFSEKEIALLRIFADQAAIAIENVRLFNETKEALEQQTATAEILRVMSGSPTDVQPVFDAIVQSGLRLFENAAVAVTRPEEGEVRLMAIAERDPEQARKWRERFPFPIQRNYMHGRAILDCRMIDMPDVELMDEGFSAGKRNFAASGYRAMTVVPMVKAGAAIGTIAVIRKAPGPLTEKQIALLKTFADQAVIAIENVRLFNETRESLEQQQASGEVLRVISSSIADTAPVFDKILESCQRIFAGRIVGLTLLGEDGMVRIGAYQGAHREEFARGFPHEISRESGAGRAILEKRVLHYPDIERDESAPTLARRNCKTIGISSVIFAPLLWEGRGLGAIFVGREHVSSFSEKEIALLRTFADQAAIAIENVRLFNEIQEKSRQLEVASRHKSAFLANMSHELRTPLNAIIGFTRIVMRRSQEKLEPQQYDNLEKILASGQHLLALINSILDLSKIEAGRIELRPAEVALPQVLEQCARTVEPLVRTEYVALVKEYDGALPQIYADEEKLRQIVINLLSNAAKFTERGSIRLAARAANGSVTIDVADTGVGIPPDKLELIFEEFEQADASSTRVHGGTGLGLAIARRLARLMGGEVTAQSTLGSGSRFSLTLPLRYRAAA